MDSELSAEQRISFSGRPLETRDLNQAIRKTELAAQALEHGTFEGDITAVLKDALRVVRTLREELNDNLGIAS